MTVFQMLNNAYAGIKDLNCRRHVKTDPVATHEF
jgi:hypothetical protein